MKDNTSILSLWETMAKEKTFDNVKRLLRSDMCIRVYGIYSYAEQVFGVAFSYNHKIKVSLESFKNLKDLKVNLSNDTSYESNYLLTIQYMSNTNLDVFAYLCDNLISSIEVIKYEKHAVKEVINRLEKWKTLFDKSRIEGLSSTEQQGLYGELTFLSKLINNQVLSKADALKVWVGPDMVMRDFQGAGWAIEVKTNSANNADQIKINGKRQLDETLLKRLFLYHLSLEISKENGETLNDKVEEIRHLLADDVIVLNSFNAKIYLVGYDYSQKYLYDNRYYKIRDEHIYNVEMEFPRIKEKELRSGVVDVDYSINISTCEEYLISEKDCFKAILENSNE